MTKCPPTPATMRRAIRDLKRANEDLSKAFLRVSRRLAQYRKLTKRWGWK